MDGTMYDLNNLIPPGSPLYLESAETINDRSEIAGTGVDVASGNEHAFLLIPCPVNNAPDCQNEIAGAIETTHASPTSLMNHSQAGNPSSSIRQMLRRRLGVPHRIPSVAAPRD